MNESPLFYLPGATEGTTQWRAETLQLVNWGGFHGHHLASFAPGATLLSGASGTGKSTLMDAYLALMMPSDTAFNGASNDAARGRARGVDQRNLLTYLQGKTDATRPAGTDLLRNEVLRGRDHPTWGALAMTFINDLGRRCTALRLYFLPRGATRTGEITMKMATRDGAVDLRDLEGLAATKFDARALKTQLPGVEIWDTYASFAQTLYTRLGIGANGDGAKALKLLARIQAGRQVETVDSLYKTMVLERPATYSHAEQALHHFEDLDASYRSLDTDAQKVRALEAVPGLHQDYQQARDRAEAIDAYGAHRSGDTPFLLWQHRTEQALLDTAVTALRQHQEQIRQQVREARSTVIRDKEELGTVEDQLRDNGGDRLEHLHTTLEILQDQVEQTQAARARFDERTRALQVLLRSAGQYDDVTTTARTFQETFGTAVQRLEEQREAANQALYPLEEKIRGLKDEQASLATRQGMMPPAHHEARQRIAEATGIPAQELPFIGELIDLAPGQEKWRRAVEVTLASLATVLLVDEQRLEDFSRDIDPLKLPVRVHFEGVALTPHREVSGDPRRISGKLVFKDSPFSGWVHARVQSPGTDALCVETPEELEGTDRRVTVHGQIRHGKRGSHGWNRGQKSVIGFSSTVRRQEITQELHALDQRADRYAHQKTQLTEQLAGLRARKEAYQYVLDTAWSSLDVEGVQERIRQVKDQQAQELAGNDVLRALQAQKDALGQALESAQKTQHLAENELEKLNERHRQLVERQDEVGDEIDRIEAAQTTPLSAGQAAELDARWGGLSECRDFDRFGTNITGLRERLAEQSAGERTRAQTVRAALTQIFESFNARWPDPNRGTTPASYSAFALILEHIRVKGLYHQRQEWKRRLAEWSGQDLLLLHRAFDTAVEDIEDRLLPVNQILAALPFGAHANRLQITVRRLHRDELSAFRRELKHLASGVTEDLTDEQAEARFQRLRTLMEQMRPGESGSAAVSGRDRLLDVRRHLEITAEQLTPAGVQVSTYTSLGDKSGGESQELVAFIVGAALRFQLGDESRTRPRFAPVFLDEGFVKSDSQFAGRAVAAWQALGFQLIIGAPLDKVTALEPAMERILAITKNTTTKHSYIAALVPAEDLAPTGNLMAAAAPVAAGDTA